MDANCVYKNYLNRRDALIAALTIEQDELYEETKFLLIDLCLYAETDGTWDLVSANKILEESDHPVLLPWRGINKIRFRKSKKQWLTLVAQHSDSWLLNITFFEAQKLDKNERAALFFQINKNPLIESELETFCGNPIQIQNVNILCSEDQSLVPCSPLASLSQQRTSYKDNENVASGELLAVQTTAIQQSTLTIQQLKLLPLHKELLNTTQDKNDQKLLIHIAQNTYQAPQINQLSLQFLEYFKNQVAVLTYKQYLPKTERDNFTLKQQVYNQYQNVIVQWQHYTEQLQEQFISNLLNQIYSEQNHMNQIFLNKQQKITLTSALLNYLVNSLSDENQLSSQQNVDTSNLNIQFNIQEIQNEQKLTGNSLNNTNYYGDYDLKGYSQQEHQQVLDNNTFFSTIQNTKTGQQQIDRNISRANQFNFDKIISNDQYQDIIIQANNNQNQQNDEHKNININNQQNEQYLQLSSISKQYTQNYQRNKGQDFDFGTLYCDLNNRNNNDIVSLTNKEYPFIMHQIQKDYNIDLIKFSQKRPLYLSDLSQSCCGKTVFIYYDNQQLWIQYIIECVDRKFPTEEAVGSCEYQNHQFFIQLNLRQLYDQRKVFIVN
eukprot:TRINITY_DN7116_c0_g3_i2.p1 TRINITY_DN7116_c0_g3~~TRINITY_DN7116_c0_g3_i2.p1  ORF type:complete len:613 (-),score=22.09 TRINITY_DN7116_c0_g3_i2:827-2644(-)